jgi:hypothetical protein
MEREVSESREGAERRRDRPCELIVIEPQTLGEESMTRRREEPVPSELAMLISLEW